MQDSLCLRAAGLDPRSIRLSVVWTREAVVAAIRERAAAGKSLRRKDVLSEDARLVKAAQRHFPSSWARALAAAGIDQATPASPARSPRHRKHK